MILLELFKTDRVKTVWVRNKGSVRKVYRSIKDLNKGKLIHSHQEKRLK